MQLVMIFEDEVVVEFYEIWKIVVKECSVVKIQVFGFLLGGMDFCLFVYILKFLDIEVYMVNFVLLKICDWVFGEMVVNVLNVCYF